jgi:mRNA interferase MazF
VAKRPALWVPERGEIIFIEHSPHAGKEMPGLHPMLVCSTSAFAAKTSVVIGFPMTHAEFNADNPFALTVKGPKNEVGYVLAFQPKSFDWRARNARPHPWGAGHDKVLAQALKKLDAICGVCSH